MAGPTSVPLALAILILLPFDIITWVLRFYVRLSRKAWGPDDWSMVIAIVSICFHNLGCEANKLLATFYHLDHRHDWHSVHWWWEA